MQSLCVKWYKSKGLRRVNSLTPFLTSTLETIVGARYAATWYTRRLPLKPKTGWGCPTTRKTYLHLVLCTYATPRKTTSQTHEDPGRGKEQTGLLLGLQAADKAAPKLVAFRYNAFSRSAKAETVKIAASGSRRTEPLSCDQRMMYIRDENPNSS